ncbi:MAG: hypothetical protein JO362_06465 [Streptomycetaceae bacterium]|nr:hypothetical protein [Streptomycetaceae bacterium]
MAFSADELRVLRRALAEALVTAPDTMPVPDRTGHVPGRRREVTEVQEYLRLAESVEEAVREGGRLRSFLLADLSLYRDALPGTAADYLERLAEALDAGYLPTPEDLAALRGLSRLQCTPTESSRREEMRRRCEDLAERAVRAKLEGRTPRTGPQIAARARLLALRGGRASRRDALDVLIPIPASAEGTPPKKPGTSSPEPKPKQPERAPEQSPGENPKPAPSRQPGREPAKEPERERRVPTPAEIWPPRRRPVPPPAQQRRAIG